MNAGRVERKFMLKPNFNPMRKTILLFTLITYFSIQNIAQTVTDIEGNVYQTVTIGAQKWMAENLKTTRLNDGTLIPYKDPGAGTNSVYCVYNDDFANKNTYGLLYDWYAGKTGKLCPSGWHVPADSEWNILMTFLGGDSIAGGKLKEAGTSHWYSPNAGATNESGFTALPGGDWDSYAAYFGMGNNGAWWSTDEVSADHAWSRFLRTWDSAVTRYSFFKKAGFSVRCLKNSNTGLNRLNNLNEIKIYPNPVNGNLNIDLPNHGMDAILRLYELTGNIVLQVRIENSENSVDVSSISKGIYLVEISDSKTIIKKKLIKN